MKQSLRAGFTLVELAIVLVIIGLLVGGVLVAQDLIKAAEIRAVSSDIERYNTGAAAFRTKFNGIPGDLLAGKASNFALPYGDGADGEGDGDGILENNVTDKAGLGGENVLFWTHLSSAQFIPFGSGTYTSAAGAGAALAATSTATAPTVAALLPMLPQLRIRDTGFIHAFGSGGLNYYSVGTLGTGDINGAVVMADALSPREALGIDEKLDDGNANRGVVLSWVGNVGGAATTGAGLADRNATPTAGVCYDSDDGSYATAGEDVANSLGCALRIRAGF